MKRIICFLLASLVTLFLFAKEIPLKVTETEWGFEVSNLDQKGKIICKDSLIFKSDSIRNYIILRKKGDTVNLEKLAELIAIEEMTYKDRTAQTIYVYTVENGNIIPARYNYNSNTGETNGTYGQMNNYESFMIVPYNSKIKSYKAFSERNDFYFIANETESEKQLLKTLVEKKKIEIENKKAIEEKKDLLKQIIAHKDTYKNDSFAYQMNSSGSLTIACYLGESKDVLEIPNEIEGIPVNVIFSMQSLTDAKFKTVVIPKNIVEIREDAFVNLGIENVVFEKGSEIQAIDQNAFRYNNITELNIPRKELTIYFDAFSDNNIKKVTVYKDWQFVYRKRAGYFYINDSETAFIRSDSLEEVVFEEGCIAVYPAMFSYCKNLKKVSLPSTMRKFGQNGFAGCESLSELVFAGIPIAEVEDYNTFAAQTEKYIKENGNQTSDNIMAPFAAAVAAKYGRETDPTSAIGCFRNCPIPLKTKRILLQMGLPNDAF
ncbi:MAG: leucine-rich repeat domain-containing protein [Spirochaetales bacterium]|nr:leucine-rich repeat domain-containing protein [Spirochaetales bacterium]